MNRSEPEQQYGPRGCDPVFLKDISRHRWLTRERERALFDEIAAGRQRVLQAVSCTPHALAEIRALGAALRQRAVHHTELSQCFGREHGFERGAIHPEMIAHFERIERAEPHGVQRLLETLHLSLHQLAKIVSKLEARLNACGPGAPVDSIRRMQRGLRDAMRARNTLLEGSLRQVVAIARRFPHTDVELMDLIQEGNIGLLIAVEKFDPRLGFRFSTYAHWWIHQAVSRAIMRKSRLVRCPSQLQEAVGKLNKVRQALQHRYGREPDERELAGELRLPIDTVRELVAASHLSIVSVDAPYGANACFGEPWAGGRETHTPHSLYLDRSMRAHIRVLLATLSPRELAIVSRRFGVNCHREHTLAELGRELSLTRERIRQILQAALTRLRKRDRNNALTEYAAP